MNDKDVRRRMDEFAAIPVEEKEKHLSKWREKEQRGETVAARRHGFSWKKYGYAVAGAVCAVIAVVSLSLSLVYFQAFEPEPTPVKPKRTREEKPPIEFEQDYVVSLPVILMREILYSEVFNEDYIKQESFANDAYGIEYYDKETSQVRIVCIGETTIMDGENQYRVEVDAYLDGQQDEIPMWDKSSFEPIEIDGVTYWWRVENWMGVTYYIQFTENGVYYRLTASGKEETTVETILEKSFSKT